MTAPLDVLAVLDPVIRDPHSGAQIGVNEEMLKVRDAFVELVKLTRKVADEHMGIVASVKYHGEDDEIGSRVCCDVLSYKDHAEDCLAVKLRALLAKFGGVS